MEQAAFLFVGSILLALTAIVLVIGILIINNLFHRFWKPFHVITESEKPHQEPTFKRD